MDKTSLTVLDWIIIIGYAIGMLLVGFYYARKNKSAEDYLLGGRGMKSWKVGISLFATLFSAITYLSLPGEMIKHGPMIFVLITALPFVYFLVAYLFIPFIMKLQVSSAYELLETRVGVQNRLLASIYFLIMRFLWMSVIIYLVSKKIIIPIMGWSEQTALMVSIVMGIITIIYTSSGGLRGVVLTDVVQSFVLFGGTILAIVMIIKEMGNPSAIIPTTWPEHWAGWVFFDTKVRVSFVTAFISTFGWYVCTAGSDQMTIQRYLATRDVKGARRMYLSSIVMSVMVQLLLLILGLALFAYVRMRPDFLGETSMLDGADTLFPRFIATVLPAGFSGIVIAGLLAAAMSSLSSGINSSSLSIVNDFILRFRNKSMSEENKIKLAQYISIAIGVIIVFVSLAMGNIRGNLLELTYKTTNLLSGPLFLPFFMAMFIRKAKPVATFIGTLLSGVTAVLVGFSYELLSIEISFLWIIPISFSVGLFFSMLLSYLPFEKSRYK
ncbi:MAG: sodium/solute symporter [Bacteroidota bacterium]